MNLTRKEVCNTLKEIKNYIESDDAYLDCRKAIAGLDAALAALRPISREQVEKVWRGEWEKIAESAWGSIYKCLRCERRTASYINFCPHCGAAMKDEAVQIVMERLEELNNA